MIPPSARPTDESAFHCAICMELLYKPCVNTCGHTFCFWCMHQSMNSLDGSHACPLCRASFAHFPAVCMPLHAYLAWSFPKMMEEREEEVKRLERDEYHANSPALNCMKSESGSVDGGFDIYEAFQCVDCHALAAPSAVMTCGHVMCCSSEEKGTKRRVNTCPVDGCVGKMRGMKGDSACALIDTILCNHLTEVEYGAATSISAQCQGLDRSDNVASANAVDTSHNSTAKGVTFVANESAIFTRLASEKGKCLNGMIAVIDSFCTSTQRYHVKLDHDRDDAPKQFTVKSENLMKIVHIGVGCDVCGIVPMSGRRYKCQDCPEDIGFDICEECYDSGVHKRSNVGDGAPSALIGRFNQQHHPDHTMNEVKWDGKARNAMNFIQMLRGLHPELALSEILGMLEMHSGDGEDR